MNYMNQPCNKAQLEMRAQRLLIPFKTFYSFQDLLGHSLLQQAPVSPASSLSLAYWDYGWIKA